LPVVGAERLLTDDNHLPSGLDRLGKLPIAPKFDDCQFQLLDPLGILITKHPRGRRLHGRAWLRGLRLRSPSHPVQEPDAYQDRESESENARSTRHRRASSRTVSSEGIVNAIDQLH